MRFNTAPTIRATKNERRGTPSESANRHASLNVNMCLLSLRSHVSNRTDDSRQFGKRFDFVIGSARQTLLALSIPIAPGDFHSKGRRGIRIPRIRGLKRNLRSWNAQLVDRELIDSRIRFVDANLLDRQYDIEQTIDPGILYSRVEHRRRSVRQDRGLQSCGLQLPEDVGHLREGVESQIELHQTIAEPRLIEQQGLQREIQGVTRHLPEIGMPSLCGTKPGILELLFAPKGGQPVEAITKHIAAAARRGRKIE